MFNLPLSHAKLAASPKTNEHDKVGGTALSESRPAMMLAMKGTEGWGLRLVRS